MVARRVSCSTLPLLRPLSLELLTYNLFSFRALLMSAHSANRMLAKPPTHASSFEAPQLHSSIPLLLEGDFNIWFPLFSSSVAHEGPMHLSCLLCRRTCNLIPLVLRNPPNLPTHRCGAALDIILSTLPGRITVHSVHLHLSVAPWFASTCYVHVISTLPRPLCLPTLCPGCSASLRWQPLWWNDACHQALVARNGSWRDFRLSGSHEDQDRFRLLRQLSSFLQDPLLERVAWFCDVPLLPYLRALPSPHPPIPCCHS